MMRPVSIDSRLHVIARWLWSFADPHGPGIKLAFRQSIAIFLIKLGSQAIKLDAPHLKSLKRRCRCAGASSGSRTSLTQIGKILGDPAVETASLFRNLSPAHNALGTCRSAELRTIERHQPGRE